MASMQQDEPKKSMSMAMAVPQLLTPDQPLSHSFVVSGPEPRMPSPPASPEFNEDATFQHKDDVLYPDDTNIDASDDDKQPLFSTSEQEQRSPTASSLSVPTPRASFSQPIEPKTPIQSRPQKSADPVQLLNTHGMDWWRFMMAQNEEFRERQKAANRMLPPPRQSRTPPRADFDQHLLSSFGRSRIEKTGRASAVTRPKTPKAVPARPVVRSQATVAAMKGDSPKRTRRKTATPDPSLGSLSNSAQPKPRTRAAPTKRIDDKPNSEWNQLPDYCPSTDSLDKMNKKMTASWTNGNPLNLDNDPDREHLHPQELIVASVLRLHCNSYLANKRRIFAARHQALLDGKDFNKTSAQVSAKIDVNKSSKLWEAFDSVGWFDKQWFEQYL